MTCCWWRTKVSCSANTSLSDVGCTTGCRYGRTVSNELASCHRTLGRYAVPNRFKRLHHATCGRSTIKRGWPCVPLARRRRDAVRRSQGDHSLHAIAEFELAAFKGRKLTYRAWNGQLRQPVVLATGKMHVTVSPQPGFLHQFTELDTLGVDKPETKCRAYNK